MDCLDDHTFTGGGGGRSGFQLLKYAVSFFRLLRVVLGDIADNDIGIEEMYCHVSIYLRWPPLEPVPLWRSQPSP